MFVCEQNVTNESVTYPMSVLRGLVTEGSHLLLMRLFALRRKVPENMKFISLNQGLGIIQSSFVSHCARETPSTSCVLFELLELCPAIVLFCFCFYLE